MTISEVFSKGEAELSTGFLKEADKIAKQHNFILEHVLLAVCNEYEVEVTYNDNKPHTLKGQWHLLTKVHEKLYNIIVDYNVVKNIEKNILIQNIKTTEHVIVKGMPDVPKLAGSNNINESHDRFMNYEPVSPCTVSESSNTCKRNEISTSLPAEEINEPQLENTCHNEVHSGSHGSVAMSTNGCSENTEMCNSNSIPNIPYIEQTTNSHVNNGGTNSIAADDIKCIKQEYIDYSESGQSTELVVNAGHGNVDVGRNIGSDNVPLNETVSSPHLSVCKTEIEETVAAPKLTKRKQQRKYVVNMYMEEDSEEEYKPPGKSKKRIKSGRGRPRKEKLQVKSKKVHSKTTKKQKTSESKTLHCESCDFVAKCNSLLVKHRLQTHLAETSLCTLCQKSFPNVYNMHSHRRTHYKRKIYRCGICNKEYKSSYLFENHQKTHVIEESKLNVTCKLCLVEFSDNMGLNDHITSSHYKKEPGGFKCNICEKDISTRKVYQHIGSHTQIALYLCDVCGKTFSKKSELCDHLKPHENQLQPSDVTTPGDTKPLSEDNTQISSTRNIKHVVKHGHGRHIYNDKEIGHPCKKCGEVFPSKWKMRTHFHNAHTEKPSKCDFCSKTFTNSIYMQRHRTWVHLKPKVKCDICDQVFTSLTMRGHIKTHQKDYQARKYNCDTCGKSYTCKAALQMHIKKVHEGYTEQHLCNICGKIFASKGNLHIHTKLHSDERPHVCHICGASYKDSGTLKIHLCSHQEKGQYKCTYCDTYFRYKCSLRGHIKIHEGRYDHVCDICGKKFRQKTSLKNHLRIHSGEKPFFCKICGMRFRFMCVLRVHIQGKHKIKKEAYVWQEDIGKCVS